MLNRLGWWSRQFADAFGWPGVLALLMIVAGIPAVLGGLLPLAGEVEALRADAERLRLAMTHRGGVAAGGDATQQVARFVDFFPPRPTLVDSLERLHLAAAAENLALPRGDYRMSTEIGGRLLRYEILLPVSGTYPRIRRFVARALAESPNLVLEDLAFRRSSVADANVEAELRLALYLRPEPGAGGGPCGAGQPCTAEGRGRAMEGAR